MSKSGQRGATVRALAAILVAGATLNGAWSQETKRAAPPIKAQGPGRTQAVQSGVKPGPTNALNSAKKVEEAKLAKQKRREASKAKLTVYIRNQGGVPVFPIVSQMAGNYVRGKTPAGKIEQRAFEMFRKTRRTTVEKIASTWQSLPRDKKSLLAGPVLKAQFLDAATVPTLNDAAVRTLMKSSYGQRLKPKVQQKTVPTPPGGRVPLLNEKTGKTDSQGQVFLASFQDIPTEPRGILQIFAGEVYCKNQEGPGVFAIGDDEIFMVYTTAYTDSTVGWVPESKTTSTYGGFSRNVKKPLNPADSVIFQRTAGREVFRPVEVTVQMIETDEGEVTWREIVEVTVRVSQIVAAAWLQVEYGITIPPEAQEIVNDAVRGAVESSDRLTYLGIDTMVVQATGIQGSPTNITATDGAITNTKRKYEFEFRANDSEYYLRDIRVSTIPPAVNGGRIPFDVK